MADSQESATFSYPIHGVREIAIQTPTSPEPDAGAAVRRFVLTPSGRSRRYFDGVDIPVGCQATGSAMNQGIRIYGVKVYVHEQDSNRPFVAALIGGAAVVCGDIGLDTIT